MRLFRRSVQVCNGYTTRLFVRGDGDRLEIVASNLSLDRHDTDEAGFLGNWWLTKGNVERLHGLLGDWLKQQEVRKDG